MIARVDFNGGCLDALQRYWEWYFMVLYAGFIENSAPPPATAISIVPL